MTLTDKILDILRSTQCNSMKQTAKCSIFHQLSNRIIIKQCDSFLAVDTLKGWPTFQIYNFKLALVAIPFNREDHLF
jgi:hypothetical protein